VEHYEPLGVAQVVQILDSLDSVSKKLWLLKSLSCGLRPSEVLRLNKAHVVNGALQLSKVISKTRTQKTPPVCTALKIILEIQESLGIAQPDDEELPDNVCRYALRSSAATHLVYSGIDHNSAADYLGHNTADMCLRTYSTKRPPGAGDSAKNYYRVKAVTIDGVEIAKDEPLYFKWLLSLLLRVLRDAGTQNDWQQTKQLALRIATEGVDEVDTDEVVGF
jgi:integrase